MVKRVLFLATDPELGHRFKQGLQEFSQNNLVVTVVREPMEVIKVMPGYYSLIVLPALCGNYDGPSLIQLLKTKLRGEKFAVLAGEFNPLLEFEAFQKGADLYLTFSGTHELNDAIFSPLVGLLTTPQTAPNPPSIQTEETFPEPETSIPLLDWLEQQSRSNRTLMVEIAGPDDSVAALWMNQGRLCHAECGNLQGLDALRVVLSWPKVTFSVQPGSQPPIQSLDLSWEDLTQILTQPQTLPSSTPKALVEDLAMADTISEESSPSGSSLPVLDGTIPSLHSVWTVDFATGAFASSAPEFSQEQQTLSRLIMECMDNVSRELEIPPIQRATFFGPETDQEVILRGNHVFHALFDAATDSTEARTRFLEWAYANGA